MNGIETITVAFERARKAGRAALIPFFTAGFPTLNILPELLRASEEAGCDLVEIGIPFSDPLADGPVLQQAATTALAQGTRVNDIYQVLDGSPGKVPRLFLTYVNPVLRRGFDTFAEEARTHGISGAIVPDLPWTESAGLSQSMADRDLALIPLVAPTSTDHHLQAIATARGFVYAVSVTGVTGARRDIDDGVAQMVARIRKAVPLPVAIGFGIATPEQAQKIGEIADGVIVGSALTVALMNDPDHAAQVTYDFLYPMRRALESS